MRKHNTKYPSNHPHDLASANYWLSMIALPRCHLASIHIACLMAAVAVNGKYYESPFSSRLQDLTALYVPAS